MPEFSHDHPRGADGQSADHGAKDVSSARVFAAHIRYFLALTARGGGQVLDEGGVVAWAGVHPFPFLVNGAAPIDGTVDPDVALDIIAEFFGAAGRSRYEVLALGGRDEHLIAAATARGLEASGPSPLQLLDRPLAREAGEPPAGVETRWAAAPDDVAEVVGVAQRAHRVYGFPDDLWPVVFGQPETILAPDVHVVVASRDGEPVATAQVHVQGGTAYVGWVAVVPEAGRLGLGSLVTRLVVDRGFEHGADTAVLEASPMGAAVYRRMGFVDVGEVWSIS